MTRNSTLFALLAVGVCTLYWPAIFAGGIFFQRDIYNYWRPHVDWALSSLARGEPIGWSPGMQFGMPFLADPSFQVFYPPSWLLVVLPPERYYTLLVAGHALLAGFGVARLLQSYGLEKGAYAGGLAMALSGPFVSMANLWHHYCGASWIPWVVWGVRRLGQSEGVSWRPFAVVLALQGLAGSAESVVMAAILAVATQWPLFRRSRPASRLVLGAVIGASIAAIQWAPTVALFSSSARKDFSIEAKLGWSLPPRLASQLVVAGDPRTREILFNNTATALTDNEIPFILGPYLGAFALPLALLGAARLPGFFAFCLTAIVGSFGRYLPGPIPSWLTILPFRYPTKVLALVSVTFAVLVGAGVHVALSRSSGSGGRRGRPLVAAMSLVGVLLANLIALPGTPTTRVSRAALLFSSGLMATAAGPGAGPLILAGIVLDAKSGVGWVNEYVDSYLFNFRPPVVDVIRRLGPHPRIFVAYSGEIWAQADLNRRGYKSASAFQATLGEILFPPHGLRFGIRHGFQPDFTGLGVTEMQAFDKFLENRFRSDIRRYLDLGAIDAVISTDNTNPLAEPEPFARFEGITSSPTRVDLWGKTPRAGLARRAILAGSLQESMTTVASADFKPGVDTVLQQASGLAGPTETLKGGQAKILGDRNDRIDIEVSSDGPGVLVLRDSLRAGWSATVNGTPVPIIRADVLLRAVRTPDGHSLVSFRYTTPGLGIGLSLGLLGIVILSWGRWRIKVGA